ncbi:four helix bundle protein [Niastella yeongjuensis]|uniref:Four helix bundle protein n=1 Tax=Niastella yeongjuensis TaxID=354355 RepID=A0A1V9EAE6_9BACT|nr:four helix bundle protein [Niastella yeongjuensis]OQP43062.1 four helix bundle protein [Niastella yeongjuensis]SEO64997.1 four helix bundle protein [Niastella yeongjuensis]
MATFNTFEEIMAWQKAKTLCDKIHSICITTNLSKDYKLKDQINGSSGSIMDNIAEGFGRVGNKEFIQFLGISLGSVCECQSQLHRILDRNYINKALFDELYSLSDEIRRMIFGLINLFRQQLQVV